MISKQEVQYIAKLAWLSLTKKEEEEMQKELSSILNYVEKLKEIDTDKIKPTSHSVKVDALLNIFRKDKTTKQPSDKVDKLVEAIPKKKGRYARVKAIL